MKPYFSIIIPTLNERKYLPRLLRDLSLQSFTDFEVIIVDGHSEDSTLLQAQKFVYKLPSLKIISSTRRHVCYQRNLGAKRARANWFIFMDADDSLPPYFLLGVKYRLETIKSDLVTFWLSPDISTPANDLIALSLNLAADLQNNLKPRFLLEAMIVISNSAFKRHGGFDTSVDYSEGLGFIARANQIGLKYRVFRDPTYKYSFRRFTSFGTLTTLQNVAGLGISTLFGKKYKNSLAKELYPMLGGAMFHASTKKKTKFIDTVKQILQEIGSQ